MFEITIKKENLLAPLLTVAGAVDKKQSLAILSHFLFRLTNNALIVTATDLEIEISAQISCEHQLDLESITVPAKKIIDIIRSLDDETSPVLSFNEGVFTVQQGRSSFKLTTLPADQYPSSEDECNEIELSLPRLVLLELLQSTHFAMSQQDVRVYLNGLYLELESGLISAVATDGHRMAISRHSCGSQGQFKLLIPKKGIQELLRLLNSIDEEQVQLAAGKTSIKLITSHFVFVSKLIEARFPPYVKAIPREQDKYFVIDSTELKKSLSRIIILAHEKSKAVLLHMGSNQVTLMAHNNEHEEAIESLYADTQGDEIKIGLNASYLLDVLQFFGDGPVRISLSNTESSILIESLRIENYQYIIMPMKI